MLSSEVIVTPRLNLRFATSKDKNHLIRLWTDPQIRKCLGGPISKSEATNRASGYIGRKGFFILVRTTDKVPVGSVSLDKYRTGETEVSYQLLPEFWGKGYAREAVEAVIKWGFSNFKLNHIIAVTQTANTSSRRLLESLNFSPVEEFNEFNEPQTKYSVTLEKLKPVRM